MCPTCPVVRHSDGRAACAGEQGAAFAEIAFA